MSTHLYARIKCWAQIMTYVHSVFTGKNILPFDLTAESPCTSMYVYCVSVSILGFACKSLNKTLQVKET